MSWISFSAASAITVSSGSYMIHFFLSHDRLVQDLAVDIIHGRLLHIFNVGMTVCVCQVISQGFLHGHDAFMATETVLRKLLPVNLLNVMSIRLKLIDLQRILLWKTEQVSNLFAAYP